MSLAAKLPWTHRFSGGFPGLSSQPLPTDADAIDYLTRMATADGAGVETGVAVAVDAFFRDTKAAGVFDALKACCILAGARTLAGALVPVVGDAPTNVADGFVEGDYSRTSGLTGDGATTYLDTNFDASTLGQDDISMSIWAESFGTVGSQSLIDQGRANSGASGIFVNINTVASRCRSSANNAFPSTSVGFSGISRSLSTSYEQRNEATSATRTVASQAPYSAGNVTLFNFSVAPNLYSDARLAFWHVGTAIDLEDLETAVSNLITAIGEAL